MSNANENWSRMLIGVYFVTIIEIYHFVQLHVNWIWNINVSLAMNINVMFGNEYKTSNVKTRALTKEMIIWLQ